MDDTRLIAEVREHPELYDHTNVNFKNTEVKHEIWSRIAYQLRQECDNESIKKVKMRWKTLRDAYVREIKTKHAISKGDQKPKRDWRYAEAMSFLSPYLTPPSLSGNKRKVFVQTAKGLREIEPVENYLVTLDDLKAASENGSSMSEVMTPETQLGISGNEYPDNIDSFFETVTDVMSPIDTQDDIDSFFKGIADTVKKLSPTNQIKIQREIVNMVLDVKLKEVEGAKEPSEGI